MHIIDYVLLAVVALAAIGAVVFLIRRRHTGGCCGSGSCTGCTGCTGAACAAGGCAACHARKNGKRKKGAGSKGA